MGMDMDKMVMARHHAEMYMYDRQLAQYFQCISNVFDSKAQSNYQMYLHHLGGNMAQPMPAAVSPALSPGMAPAQGMMCPMMHEEEHAQDMSMY